jgi:hypothetical protein
MKLETSDLLFSDKLAPITTNMGFIENDFNTVVDEFYQWRKENVHRHDPKAKVEKNLLNGDLENIIKSLLPLKMGQSNRNLFIPTSSKWVAYMDNGYRGTDPSAVSYMAEHIKCRSVWIVAEPHTKKNYGSPRIGRSGALILELHGPEKTEWLNLVRSIRLEHDVGKWSFKLRGKPLPFENLANYDVKRKTDKLTFDTFSYYLSELGIYPFSQSFYLPDNSNFPIMINTKWHKKMPSINVSLKRARRLNGIDKSIRIRGVVVSRKGYF